MRRNWMRRILHADQRPKQNQKEENLPALPQKIFLLGKRTWTDVEPGECSLSDYDISKKLIHLLRHGNQVHRNDDGAVQFLRIKETLQKHFLYCHLWSDEKWKKSMAGGGNKKRYQYFTDSSGAILYLRALQGHSQRNSIDPSLQDSALIPDNFFEYIYHVGCTINLHSIINSGLIPGGQKLNNRQTVFFLPVDPMDKNHKDPDTIDLNKPRHAQYMHKAWKRHQNTVYWVDINLAVRKGLKFYQTRSNAIILHETLPAYCIPKVVRMETGESHIRESIFMSPRPPPKISLKHDWKRELGSEDAQRPEGQVSATVPEVSNRTNQFQTQVVIERGNLLLEPIERSNLLLELTREPCKMEEKRPVPRRSIHVLFTKKLSKPIERGNPFLKRVEPKHVHLMTARCLNVEMAHDRTGATRLLKQTQKMYQMVAKHVLVMKA